MVEEVDSVQGPIMASYPGLGYCTLLQASTYCTLLQTSSHCTPPSPPSLVWRHLYSHDFPGAGLLQTLQHCKLLLALICCQVYTLIMFLGTAVALYSNMCFDRFHEEIFSVLNESKESCLGSWQEVAALGALA